jgi:hypothetical protein
MLRSESCSNKQGFELSIAQSNQYFLLNETDGHNKQSTKNHQELLVQSTLSKRTNFLID